MALVRVYCGLASADEVVRTASAASHLTVAVVDDAGRLLGVHRISDDPAGYAQLGSLLVERTAGFAEAAVAADSDDHLVTSLLIAAGRPLVVADDDAADDFAERFADDDSPDEMQAPQAARRAVGLARAMQAGAIAAVNVPPPRDLTSYKPILAAHVAMLNGRFAAAVALREVLRELYPAALRAYTDPAHPLALAVLDALPEPGRLTSRGADPQQIAEDVAAELTRAGVGTEDQVAGAVTALTVAISESPRRGGVNKSLSPAAADTVRYAIGAVRSCDAACEALVGTLAARVTAPAANASGRRTAGSRRAPEPVTGMQPVVRPMDTGTRLGRRGRPEPAAGNAPVTPHPLTSPPVAPAPIMPPPLAPRPVTPPIAPAAAYGSPPSSYGSPSAPTSGFGSPTAPASGYGSPSAPISGSSSPTAPASGYGSPGGPFGSPGGPFGSPGNRPVSVPPPPPGMTPIVPGARPPMRPSVAPASGPSSRPPASSSSRPVSLPPAASTPSSPATPSFPPASALPPAASMPGAASMPPPAESGQPFRPTLTNAAINNARAERQRTVIPPRPSTRNGVPSAPPANGATDYSLPMPSPRPSSSLPSSSLPLSARSSSLPASAPPAVGEPGSRANWPLLNSDETTTTPINVPPSDGRVRPPWQDMPKEPPALRLVESGLDTVAADITAITEPPPLRLVDHSPNGRNGRSPRRSTLTALERSTQPPVPAEGDGDLLIFAAARSAWFTGTTDEPAALDWTNPNDTGWRAAEKAATPSFAAETPAGLPKRVPQANLVPGSPLREERPLRIVRDAASIAAHTTGYFRGWRRGQEIGGYAIGGRPGRESAGGWDFSREGGQGDDYRNGSGFPNN